MQAVVVVHLEGQPRAQVTLAVFQTLQVLTSFSLARPREVGTFGAKGASSAPCHDVSVPQGRGKELAQ